MGSATTSTQPHRPAGPRRGQLCRPMTRWGSMVSDSRGCSGTGSPTRAAASGICRPGPVRQRDAQAAAASLGLHATDVIGSLGLAPAATVQRGRPVSLRHRCSGSSAMGSSGRDGYATSSRGQPRQPPSAPGGGHRRALDAYGLAATPREGREGQGPLRSEIAGRVLLAQAAGKGSGGLGRMADPSQSSFATAYARQPRRVWPARVKSGTAEECEGSRAMDAAPRSRLESHGSIAKGGRGQRCGAKDWQHCRRGEGPLCYAKARYGAAAVNGKGASWEDSLGESILVVAAQQRPVQECLAESGYALAAELRKGEGWSDARSPALRWTVTAACACAGTAWTPCLRKARQHGRGGDRPATAFCPKQGQRSAASPWRRRGSTALASRGSVRQSLVGRGPAGQPRMHCTGHQWWPRSAQPRQQCPVESCTHGSAHAWVLRIGSQEVSGDVPAHRGQPSRPEARRPRQPR
jgi:hypothetical protein